MDLSSWTYEQLIRKALGVAFIGGPALFVLAAIVKLNVGMERESFVEGILIGYGSILFVAVFLELARVLGQEMPVFGLLCAMFGLAGMTAAMVPAAARVWQLIFLRHGVSESVWVLIRTSPELLALGLLAPLGPLTSVLLGAGLWRTSGLARWAALLLVLAGGAFILAQALQIGFLFFYPLATVAWLIALAPVGWRYLRTPLPA